MGSDSFKVASIASIERVDGNSSKILATKKAESHGQIDFGAMLKQALNSVSEQQIETQNLAERLVADPESVNAHEITTAMAKAKMSLNLAQTVIDRAIRAWNEISTTR